MGHTHNRKRTRSRPRSRGSNNPTQHTIPTSGVVPALGSVVAPTCQLPNTFSGTVGAFDKLSLMPSDIPATTPPYKAWQTDSSSAKRQRMFGSDSGDIDGEMCGSMLQVVLDLFDGIDYEET
ncbi:hypothetical protein MBLNU457_g0157t1 [Dothideomycetes sp. NU457]